MDAKEKIEYVRKNINEIAQTSPRGAISFLLYTITHADSEEWTLLSVSEQKRILEKLEENNEIKNLKFEGDRRISLEVVYIKKEEEIKTSTDYIIEAVNYFKDEYNKAKISGLTYEYNLGMNFALANFEPEPNAINHAFYRAKAIGQLKKVGLIKKYKIEHRGMDDYGSIDDYAICIINENKLTGKEEPPATDAEAKSIIKKVLHEHTHHFENSIQEKYIILNHKYEDGKPNINYITQKGDDFQYKGKHLELSKNAEYYSVFCSLFAKLPDGGEISYKELTEEIQSRLPKTKGKTNEEMRKFIQANLTDANNGFVRYAKIPTTEDNGKPLIKIIRGSGVMFNNKRG